MVVFFTTLSIVRAIAIMSGVKYTFYHLPNKEADGLHSKIVQEYLLKW